MLTVIDIYKLEQVLIDLNMLILYNIAKKGLVL